TRNMRSVTLLTGLFLVAPLFAQETCPATPMYSRCELAFELNDAEASAHANPYLTVELHAEFRSPRHRTLLIPAYWYGGLRFVLRFPPNDAGEWEVRTTSNIERFNGKILKVEATASESPGFIRVANVHHWAYSDNNNEKPHLWMGDTNYQIGSMASDAFQRLVDDRAQQ